jgi:hypothetical protein
MWKDGDDTIKRGMVRAVKKSEGIILMNYGGEWTIDVGTAGSKGVGGANGIVDLGNGLCFRR